MAKKKINWGRETLDAFSSLLHGFRRVFTVIGCVLITLLIIGILCGLIVGTSFAVYLSDFVDADIEQFEILASDQKQTSQIYVDDGSGNLSELENQKLHLSENRVWVNYEDIPQYLKDAYISIEDKRFNDHNGVDWIRTAKATLYYVLGNDAGGGSTLTQQLIKNITGENDNTPQRKVEEIFRALNLEKRYSKEQILEMYLNTIYLSQGCNGVQAASYTYFGKPVSELGLLECAAIAAITQNPSKWDPMLHPENNIIRRDSILDYMLEQGKITKAEYDEAYGKQLVIYEPEEEDDPDEEDDPQETPSSDATSWYVDVVIEDSIGLIMDHYGVTYKVAEQMLFTGGLKIVTAMDTRVQKVLEDAYSNTDIIDSIIGANPGMIKPQSSMVVLDPDNGNILGLVGGRGEKYKSRVFNYATQAYRQTGSSIKPLAVYGPSLQAGIINYSTVFDDSPYQYDENGVGWPKNSPVGYKGLTPIINGITNSVNTIAIKLVDKLGLENSYKFLTEKLHISTLYRDKTINGLVYNDVTLSALGLGGMTYGISVRELVGGYTMFTNDGIFCEPRAVLRICDTEGNVVINNELKTEVCLSKENASIMTKMMNNVVINGTGSSVKLKNYVFTSGKTGTTSKNNDKWFVGYTPYYLGGVWFGYEKPQSLSNFSGNPAMKIWDYVMTELHNQNIFTKNADGTYNYTVDQSGNAIPKIFSDVIDAGVLTVQFCMDCGKLATDNCENVYRGSTTQNRTMTGYFTVDNMPTETCDCHVSVRFCNEGHHLANEYCPDNCCENRILTVTDMIKGRYTYNDQHVYAYRSDENYVFYRRADKSLGGLLTDNGMHSEYESFCTVHSKQTEQILAPAPDDKDKTE